MSDEEVLDLQAITKQLQCPICLGTLEKPVKTLCSHWFCRRCIGNALPSCYGKCPSCRQNVPTKILRSDRLVQNLVSELAVRCHNHKAGCFWTGPSKARADHENVCLVNQISELQMQVLQVHTVRHLCERQVYNLKVELQREVEKNRVLVKTVERLEEQAKIDKATIEGLRLLKSPVTDAVQLKKDHAKELLDTHSAVGSDDAARSLEVATTPNEATQGSSTCRSEALLSAIRAGDSQSLMLLLQEETRLPVVSPIMAGQEVGAFHHAISCTHVDMAKLVLETAPSKIINARDQCGNTWLHHASCLGSEDVVNLLLANEEFLPVCLQNDTGRTALHCAAAYGREEVAKMLLNSSRFSDDAVHAIAEEEDMLGPADKKHFAKEDGLTALHLAAKFGHLAVAEALLETPRFQTVSNASTFVYEYSALHVASCYGHCDVAEALLLSRAFETVNALEHHGSSALHVAAHYGQSSVAELLLWHPRFQIASSKNRKHEATALHAAAEEGHAEAARVLLSAQGRFSTSAVNSLQKHGSTALHIAALCGHLDVAQELLDCARFNAVNACNLGSGTALHTAAFHGHADVVHLLLSHPRFTASALPNEYGQTALHLAASKGHTQVAMTLLGSHDHYPWQAVNATTDVDHATALHVAVRSGHEAMVSWLLQTDRFDTVNSQTAKNGHTALHLAAKGAHPEIIAAVLKSKRFSTDAVNAVDSVGRTALHLMVERGSLVGVQLLRGSKKFSKPRAKSERHGSALDVAKRFLRGRSLYVKLKMKQCSEWVLQGGSTSTGRQTCSNADSCRLQLHIVP